MSQPTMPEARTASVADRGGRAPRPRWAPRVWLGCGARAWWGLLRRHRFAVGWGHAYIAAVDTIASLLNSFLGGVEQVVYGRRIARAEMAADPLFIIGHWRSGTTLLHELICLDRRHACPTAYQCCAPHHFLLTERILPRLLWFLAPGRRPIDAMELGFGSAFEDEFALCLLGARSPYESIAFPNSGGLRPELFDPQTLQPGEARRWRALLVGFLKKLTLRYPRRRLVLKSPPHTCRIRVLLELFPRAQFVHIVRNPYDVFPSAMHLWRTLHCVQGLQRPAADGLEERVFSTFLHLHACLERDRPLIPAGQFHELRYEDLVRDPAGELRRLYDHLHWAESAEARDSVDAYFAARAGYATNRYELSVAEREAIRQQWGDIIRRYGYEDDPEFASPRE
jgi:omega-hydroxy-beta-dihydromenaquinone-9 sulfotransferase